MQSTRANTLSFCGNPVSDSELKLINEIVSSYQLPRSELAQTICELLDWVRPNGNLKWREALDFLVDLESQGLLTLPESQGGKRSRKIQRTEQGISDDVITGTVKSCAVEIETADTKESRDYWAELVDRYHYLGFKIAFGARLQYWVRHGETKRPLACIQFSSPALKVACRDHWIGWDARNKDRHLQRLIQQSRFLILPSVQVKGLASHVLAKVNRRVADDWETHYAVRPVLVETFVDRSRFQGTCYRAANWIDVGVTQGRGRMDRHHRTDRTIKSVFLKPLTNRFRHELGVTDAP